MNYAETHAYSDMGPASADTRDAHLRAHTNHVYRPDPGAAIKGAMIEVRSADPERFARYLPIALDLERSMPGAGARSDEWAC